MDTVNKEAYQCLIPNDLEPRFSETPPECWLQETHSKKGLDRSVPQKFPPTILAENNPVKIVSVYILGDYKIDSISH